MPSCLVTLTSLSSAVLHTFCPNAKGHQPGEAKNGADPISGAPDQAGRMKAPASLTYFKEEVEAQQGTTGHDGKTSSISAGDGLWHVRGVLWSEGEDRSGSAPAPGSHLRTGELTQQAGFCGSFERGWATTGPCHSQSWGCVTGRA